eukprot:TRINITY_DN4803_c0_g1_i1.p1 TRINITY_DN4803_c0_g1~~TRINITY_DN4803_c0_g1_i1.p1  ORF type:complete len:357 (-),score=90.31 TRINITY_DN4803_c0_g1_i1:39-1109(-)
MSRRTSSRKGKGSKMKGLMAHEELLQGDNFWSEGKGAQLWETMDGALDDDAFDAEANIEEDVVDDDFDVPEDPALDTEVLGDETEVKKKKKNVYVDPRRQGKKRAGEPKEKKDWKRNAPIVVAPSDRTLRRTTVVNTLESEAQRKIDEEEENQRQAQKEREVKSIPKMSQMQLLEEAKETEILNLQSLEEMKRLDLLKKKKMPTRYKITGPKIVEITNIDGTFVCFNNTSYPAIFNSKSDPYPEKAVCAVTGLPAKYFDPLTQTPYATIEAFQTLRERYKQQKKQLEEELEKQRLEEEAMDDPELHTRVRNTLRTEQAVPTTPSSSYQPQSMLVSATPESEGPRYNTRTRTPRAPQ